MGEQRELVRHLNEDECWALLAEKDFGRLAVSIAGQPEIFPVNYAASDGAIYLRTAEGTEALRAYYEPYLEVAREHRAPFVLGAPTWRSSPDWGAQLGYDADQLAAANRRAVDLMHEIRAANPDLDLTVDAVIGPREWESDRAACTESVDSLGYPVFVKPARGGSSIGISKVHRRDELGVGLGNFLDREDALGRGGERVAAQAHRYGPGVSRLAAQREVVPAGERVKPGRLRHYPSECSRRHAGQADSELQRRDHARAREKQVVHRATRVFVAR